MAALSQKRRYFLLGSVVHLYYLIRENIGEFSRCHYNTWDKKCPSRNIFMLIINCLDQKVFLQDFPPLSPEALL